MSNRTEELAKRNFFDELLAIRDKQRKEKEESVLVIKGKDLPIENNRHGLMQWYLHPNISDVAINSEIIYVQHIPPGSRSGKQHHPGGKLIYYWSGKGRTIIEGVTYSWVSNELLQLPLRPDGVSYQHYNDSPDETAKLITCEPNFVEALGLDKGSMFEQLQDSPDFKR